jgi:hypothetical protein
VASSVCSQEQRDVKGNPRFRRQKDKLDPTIPAMSSPSRGFRRGGARLATRVDPASGPWGPGWPIEETVRGADVLDGGPVPGSGVRDDPTATSQLTPRALPSSLPKGGESSTMMTGDGVDFNKKKWAPHFSLPFFRGTGFGIPADYLSQFWIRTGKLRIPGDSPRKPPIPRGCRGPHPHGHRPPRPALSRSQRGTATQAGRHPSPADGLGRFDHNLCLLVSPAAHPYHVADLVAGPAVGHFGKLCRSVLSAAHGE